MKRNQRNTTDSFIKIRKHGKHMQRGYAVLALLVAVVMLFVPLVLALPAATASATTYCGMDEHKHTDTCYEKVLVCGLEAGETEGADSVSANSADEEAGTADDSVFAEVRASEAGHQHTDACYETRFVCEKEEHTHEKMCFRNPEADAETATEQSVAGQADAKAAEQSETSQADSDAETAGRPDAERKSASIEKNVLASDGKNYKVTVSYGDDAGIPDNADLSVEEITETASAYGMSYDAYVAKTEDALGMEEGSAAYIRLFDIKIVSKDDPDVKYQPADGTTVDVEIALADTESEGLSVVHFADEGEAGEVVESSTETGEDGQVISFEADGFSIYVVTDTTKRLIYEFYKNGQVVASQYVKGDEILVAPGVESDYGQTFIGWYIGESIPANLNESDLIQNIDGLNADLAARKDAGFEDGDTVKVHAVYREAWYLRYMYQDEGGQITVLKTEEMRKDAASHAVTIIDGSDYTTDTFEYWIDVTDGTQYTAGQSLDLNQHMDLYLKVQGRNWLVFDANAGGPGSGATYTTPQLLVGEEAATVRPADPTRKGYRFTGWNTAADGSGTDWLTVAYDAQGNPGYTTNNFGGNISEDTILYAQWEGIPTDYYVVFWKQKVDAAGNDPKSDYEYVVSEKRTGLAGEIAAIEAADTQKAENDSDYEHFVYNADLSDTDGLEINADGSTVLNVYYDRQTYKMRFFFARAYETTIGGTTTYEYIPVATTSNNGTITWNNGYSYSAGETYYRNTNGGRAYYKNTGWFSTQQKYDSTYYRINNGTIYIRQPVTSGGTTRTYLQINNNDEGFRYHRTNGLENALKYVKGNDYQRTGNTNTWKTVNTTDVSSLISESYLSDNGLSFDPETDYITVDNVTTWVFTSTNGTVPGNSSVVSAKYYYIPIAVRYGQNLSTIWPGASNFNTQTISNYNYEQRGSNIYPLMWGFFSSGNSQSGAYEKADDGLIYNTATGRYEDYANFLLYWRFETYSTYAYRVYFSALDGETGGVTIGGKRYIEQPDLNYIATLGTGVNINEIQTLSFNGVTLNSRVNSTTATTYNGQNVSGTVSVYYDRNIHDITFITKDHLANDVTREDHVIADIPYGTDISKYAENGTDYYRPFNGDAGKLEDGYFFTGWYADPECTIPYDFSGKTMPDSNITVYAKIETYRTRIVLIPTKDNLHNDEVALANDQALIFRLDRNEILHSTNINAENAVRHGYKLVGWYYDEDYQHDYRLDEPVNENTLGVNMDYQSTEDWENNTYGDNPDNNGKVRSEVKAILKLYAKWALDIKETDVFIEYEVEDQYRTDNTIVPIDPTAYTLALDAPDTATITTNAASAPGNYANGFSFKEWVLLDADGNETDITFKPGDAAAIQKLYVQTRTIGADIGDEGTLRYIKLRAKFDVSSEAATSVTFHGNGGVTNDEASRTEVSQAWLVNQDFTMMDEDSFVREGYDLIGWSFDPDTTAADYYAAIENHPGDTDSDLQALAELGLFKPGEAVAADNEWLTEVNNWEPLENKIYAIWEPHKFTVTITKEVAGETAADKAFTFTAAAPGFIFEETQTGYAMKENEVEANVGFDLANTHSKTITEVPYGTELSFTEAPYPGYVVENVDAKQISDPDGNPLENSVNLAGEDGKRYKVYGDIAITYTNKKGMVPVVLKKVGYHNTDPQEQTHPLTGATFKIHEGSINGDCVTADVGGEEISEFTSAGADAVFFNGELKMDVCYYLEETEVPAGYDSPAGHYYFVITQDGITLGCDVPTGQSSYDSWIEEQTEGGVTSYTISIRNVEGIELPSTGGSGTRRFTILGGILILGAGVMLWRRRKLN